MLPRYHPSVEIGRGDVEMRRRKEPSRKQICERKIDIAYEFGSSLETPRNDFVRDVSLLPYPKHEILDAILFAIANAENKLIAELFSRAASALASYQEGVGDKPIILPEVNELDRKMSPAEFQKFMESFDLVRFKKFANAMTDEANWILSLTERAKAANLHLQPAYKKLWQRICGQGLYAPFFDGYVDFGYTPAASAPAAAMS